MTSIVYWFNFRFMKDENFVNVFAAVRGVQSGRPCYIAMCPMRIVPILFRFDEEDVPPELRAQRTLNRARVPDISNYLTENSTNYTLSSLTVSVNGKVKFTPVEDTGLAQNMGTLTIPMGTQMLINDGQHRRAAIEKALELEPELGHDHISVLFYIDGGLERSQQMFADLNKHAVRPSTSLGTLYDRREQTSELARYLVNTNVMFKKLTELEKTSISNRSSKLFTISSIKNASKALLRKSNKDDVNIEEMDVAKEYWSEVHQHIFDWQAALNKQVTTAELRENYIHAHAVMLHAMGNVGADLISRKPKTWKVPLKKLRKIDWSRSNDEWEGRAMVLGRISKARTNVLLTGNFIKQKLGLPLNDIEQAEEDIFTK